MSRSADADGLGARLTDDGAEFRVWSRNAESVDLCLWHGPREIRLPMERDGDVWCRAVPNLAAGDEYGYRADGPSAPERGHRFDVAKLLLDPCARRVGGPVAWSSDLDGDRYGVDSAAVAPRSVLVDDHFEWHGDTPPRTPWNRTVLYEAHVKGLTRLHPALPREERGTFRGLAHPAVIEHLHRLGVTTLQLLPVQQHFVDRHLVESGLTNYWGYSPLAWFAPRADLSASEDPIAELKSAIRRLHRAGLEVVLDVVFNHTAEGDGRGPTLSLRGLDNREYYRLDDPRRSRYVDTTGCGNSLDFGRPHVVRLALDCLRYWVEEFHVDGFRFDLAVTLARGADGEFSPESPFLQAIAADPLLSTVKLIAEPWDLGSGGYQLGSFPTPWREWNDRFREEIRRYALSRPVDASGVSQRLHGSEDLFGAERARAAASVNFVACHDGFTLADCVAYDERHNRANGEDNRDGNSHEESANLGVEGETSAPDVRARRKRSISRMLSALALARGVPMLSHGDEFGRSQGGNNNAYCQDNPTAWVDWSDDDAAWIVTRWRRLLRRRWSRCDE